MSPNDDAPPVEEMVERLVATGDEPDELHGVSGEWVATTTGDSVVYCHECPSCGPVRRRTLRSKSSEESDDE